MVNLYIIYTIEFVAVSKDGTMLDDGGGKSTSSIEP